MGRKSNQRKKKQKRKSSSWLSAVISFLKEMFLNSDTGIIHVEYDENLTEKGKRKKDLLWAVIAVLSGLYLGTFPLREWEVCTNEPVGAVIVEGVAVVMLIFGIWKFKKYKS